MRCFDHNQTFKTLISVEKYLSLGFELKETVSLVHHDHKGDNSHLMYFKGLESNREFLFQCSVEVDVIPVELLDCVKNK